MTDILVVCTANICRSPMAAALLSRRLSDFGVASTVRSAGLIGHGEPATPHSTAVMESRGIFLASHRSRRADLTQIAAADLILGMERAHVREIVVRDPDAWPRSFTLKEILRRGQVVGPREPGEELAEWLGRVHQGRETAMLLGTSTADDIADPRGSPHDVFEATARELEGLINRLVHLAWHDATRSETPLPRTT